MTTNVVYRLIGDDQLTVILGYSEHFTIDRSNADFDKIVSKLKTWNKDAVQHSDGFYIWGDDEDWLRYALDPKKKIQKIIGSCGDVVLEGSQLYYQGEPCTGFLANRIIALMDEDETQARALANFLERLQKNPSMRIRDQLFAFLEKGGNAFTPDGCFLAYKYVNDNYTSCFDNKTLHIIGSTVEIPREKVNDDPEQTCSYGLHCCSISYLGSYIQGKRIVVVKVDPADVIAVPIDYSNAKMRVCRYRVVGELDKTRVEQDYLASKPVIPDYEPEEEDDYRYEKAGERSSFIFSAKWDDSFRQLTIEFNNRKTYAYNVDYETAMEFMDSDDWSHAFHELIKGAPEEEI